MLAPPYASRPRPRADAARAWAWLESAAVVDDRGAVMSWHNPRHPGFDYPEAAGLWLVARATDIGAPDIQADRVARRLARRVVAGEVGRDGAVYAFDLGVVLVGLHAHHHAGGMRCPDATQQGTNALLQALAERRAAPAERPPRWSTHYGPHLLKLAIALARLPGAAPQAALARLFDDLADAHDHGRWLTAPDHGPTYVHAHCYATEGLWAIAHGADPPRAAAARDRLRPSVDWLADIQRADGGVPSHHDGYRGRAPARTDATAQAVRLWAATEPARHHAAIARGLAFLESCTTPEGAVRYEPGSDDFNTWSTIFALQAGRMAARSEPRVPPEAPW